MLSIILNEAVVALFKLIFYSITISIYATSVVILSNFIGALYALITITVATIAFVVIFSDTIFNRQEVRDPADE